MDDDLPNAVFSCPICRGLMEVVYQRFGQIVVVCAECHTGLTIPKTAPDVLKRKREGTWTPPKPHDDD